MFLLEEQTLLGNATTAVTLRLNDPVWRNPQIESNTLSKIKRIVKFHVLTFNHAGEKPLIILWNPLQDFT